MRSILTFIALAAVSTTAMAESPQALGPIVEELVKPYQAAVVIHRPGAEPFRHNPTMCAEPASPCSTFKIPNSLIGLETGVLDGPEFVIKWDGVERWLPAGNADQTLRSAYQNSVVWYYQEVARRIGAERMQTWLDKFEYGNRDISGGIDQFWLGSSIKISADEQVAFLKRLQGGQLPISAKTLADARQVMQLDEREGIRLFGKTGTDGDSKTQYWKMGWFVGWLEPKAAPELPVFFAVRITGGDGKAWGKEARRIAEEILIRMDEWPKAPETE